MSVQEDKALLAERRCTNVKTIECGDASLTQGYSHEARQRLYCMRYGDKVERFHLPARASSHARREAFWRYRANLVHEHPSADAELLFVVREAVRALKAS